MDPQPETNNQPITLNPEPPPKPSRHSAILAIVIVLCLASLAVTSYFYYQNQQLKKLVILTEPTPTLQPPTIPARDAPNSGASTASWQTFKNTKPLNYQVSYPDSWTLDSSNATDEIVGRINITHDDYDLEIYYPTAFGGGRCVFQSDSNYGSTEYGIYSVDKYTEFESDQYTFRRHILNSEDKTHLKYAFCIDRKNDADNTFETADFVPLISYTVPLHPSETILNEMDQILSTFQFSPPLSPTTLKSWQTYTFPGYPEYEGWSGFTISFPISWKKTVTERAEDPRSFTLTLNKNNTSIKIEQLAGGGSSCLFPEDPDMEGMYARYGQYFEIHKPNSVDWRIAKSINVGNMYGVCEKPWSGQKTEFVDTTTAGYIRISTPEILTPEHEIIKILESIKFNK